jgi:hypothetical protein
MNWLEHARREIRKNARRPAANSAERNPAAVTAVPEPENCKNLMPSIGSNGSTSSAFLPANEAARQEFEERAAIMEFDGGLTRDEAEREAWKLISTRNRLH